MSKRLATVTELFTYHWGGADRVGIRYGLRNGKVVTQHTEARRQSQLSVGTRVRLTLDSEDNVRRVDLA